MKVDKAMLYGGIVPLSRDQLQQKVEEMGAQLTSASIPTVALKLGYQNGQFQNGLLMGLSPTEDPQDKVGMGHYPILEIIGSSAPVFPNPEDVAKQLAVIMRMNHPTNNVNLSRLRGILASETLPSATTGNLRFDWPAYTLTRPERTNTTERNASG